MEMFTGFDDDCDNRDANDDVDDAFQLSIKYVSFGNSGRRFASNSKFNSIENRKRRQNQFPFVGFGAGFCTAEQEQRKLASVLSPIIIFIFIRVLLFSVVVLFRQQPEK